MKLSRIEIETVIEDVEYLQDKWAKGAKDPELRRGSAILRRLVVEKYLGHAWRAVGFEKEPKISCVDLDYGLADTNIADIETAFAGGALSGGIYVAFACNNKGSVPVLMRDGFLSGELTLTNYEAGMCAVVDGAPIIRRDLIKYMANVKGGVHLGSSRARRKEQDIIRRIAKIENRIQVTNSDGLFYEILSIGQSIANSIDVQKFVKKFRS